MAHFVKSHGLGNDYLVIDPARVPFSVTPENLQLLCDRHLGVGADGVLVVDAARGADFGLRIYNSDGTSAEQGGNGISIFAKYLREHGYTTKDCFTIDTPSGPVSVQLRLRNARVAEVTAEVGTATFGALDSIEADRRRLAVTSVSIGNPHCVVIMGDLAKIDPRTLGPKIESHHAFPAKTNVQFAEVLSRSHIAIEIWERGAGYTLASGTSACAVAAAAFRKELVDRDVTVTMPGGELEISVGEGYAMRMRGPVEEVLIGDFSADLLAHL